jgi:FMN phosphatase YigB (HAD superfamily)
MNLKARCRCALLDLDGTLLDYASAQASAVREALSELGVENRGCDQARFLAFVNSPDVQAFEACKPGAPSIGSSCFERSFPPRPGLDSGRFLSCYFSGLARQGGTIPGAMNLLSELRGAGMQTGAVSNGPGPVQRSRLLRSGLMGGLGAIVLSCEAGIAKPDPGIFGIALRLLGMQPSDTVMIGDSASSDMAGAEAAGLDFLYFRPDGDFSAHGRRIAEASSLDQVALFLVG